MPTFCRHNRFIERCPICSSSLPGAEDGGEGRAGGARGGRSRGVGAGGSGIAKGSAARARVRAREDVRVRRHERASADGYSSALLPGVRASVDAERFAAEIAFSAARVALLRTDPPDLYGEIAALAATDRVAAARSCFLAAYLSPAEDAEPFAAIRAAIADAAGTLPSLAAERLGPRTSHDPARGTPTLEAYERVVEQAGGASAAFTGDESWMPTRRFERLFERLALPGLTRTARYELLLLLGALGVSDVQADSLHLGVARGAAMNDATTLAAKRIFAIGDAINLERRCGALARALQLDVAVLELALWNFSSDERATLGFPGDLSDVDTLARAHTVLGL